MQRNISDTYEILGKIGEGNSGEIYKAYHKNLGKEVVLKKVKTEIKDFVNNRAEVDVLKNLRHSCLPQVLDFLQIDGDVYTVMDFIPGNSFKQYLDAGTVFPEKSVLIWAKQICATLGYLHNQNPPIIHSDLKPGNIMLMPNGNICLIDFNISASLDGNCAWVTGFTSGYAAPEQIQAMKYNQNELDRSRWKTVDARADIYSFGATIYHIMTGQKPKPDEGGFVEDIRNKGRKINDVFASVIMKCLEPNPQKRYQSAELLLSDLKNIQAKDKRYRRLIQRQKIIYICTAAVMFLSAGVAVSGYFRMDAEKQKKYELLVRQEAECISASDFDDFEMYYQEAVNLKPKELEAYYQKALALHQQRQYGDAIEFIQSEILNNPDIINGNDALNNVYYLLGNCYEKQEDYAQAANCYGTAITIMPDNADYYRDYAIALAYNGDMEGARDALAEAKEQQLDSVEIRYIEGEIAYVSQDYAGAGSIFQECIRNTKDEYIKMRAYIMAAKCLDASGDGAEILMQKVKMLEEAAETLSPEYNIGILEQLGQAYSDMSKKTGDTSYDRKAIEVFKKIKEQGMGSYSTDYNLAVLYQNVKDYDKASSVLNQMLTDYGENYKTYKSLALLEVAKQSDRPAGEKTYGAFKGYYEKAQNLYQEQLANNVNDVEMDRLKELYDQAVANGWIQ